MNMHENYHNQTEAFFVGTIDRQSGKGENGRFID